MFNGPDKMVWRTGFAPQLWFAHVRAKHKIKPLVQNVLLSPSFSSSLEKTTFENISACYK